MLNFSIAGCPGSFQFDNFSAGTEIEYNRWPDVGGRLYNVQP